MANATRAAILGAYPSQTELFEKGLVQSPLCPLCGAEAGTLQHVYFKCRAPEVLKICAAFEDAFDKDNFRDILHRCVVGTNRWLWERAILPKPAKTWAWIPPSDVIHRAPGCTDGIFEGRVATDGSAVNGNYGETSKGGWAVSMGNDNAIYGPLPFPEQTVLAGELWAIYALLRHALWLTEVIIDNATVVKGLLRGEVWCCASARPWAHLWRRICVVVIAAVVLQPSMLRLCIHASANHENWMNF